MSRANTNRIYGLYCSGSTTPGQTPPPVEFESAAPLKLRKVSPVIREVFQVIVYIPIFVYILFLTIFFYIPYICVKKGFIFLKKKVEFAFSELREAIIPGFRWSFWQDITVDDYPQMAERYTQPTVGPGALSYGSSNLPLGTKFENGS